MKRHHKTLLSLVTALFLATGPSAAQHPEKLSASEIYESVRKLNFLGSVLYVAAHPDDENTWLISHFANGVKARTAYLSITRGDGGQNLIGTELGDMLGVIRTQELLEARKTDGGEQFFTRARDFGFSKTPDETLGIWGEETVLGDVVWAIRKFRPDIIITRFDHRAPVGSTHGHHIASAMLAVEAFDLAGDAEAFPEQLRYVKPWQPRRLFYNLSWWSFGGREAFEKADKSHLTELNTGLYYPSHGLSNGEIASLSRSKHQSQGFGNTGVRGASNEYLEQIKGDPLPDKTDVFSGIKTGWDRVADSREIGKILDEVKKGFDFTNPAASLPKLMDAHVLLKSRTDPWSVQKTKELRRIIAACTGLFLETVAPAQNATPGERLDVRFELTNRSEVAVELVKISFDDKKIHGRGKLDYNTPLQIEEAITLPENRHMSPYWLEQKGATGHHVLTDMELTGLPEIEKPFPIRFDMKIDGRDISFERNIVYKYNDPATGEVYEPFQILPTATLSLSEKALVFPDKSAKQVRVSIRAGKDKLSGAVRLHGPKNWDISPPQQVKLVKKGATQELAFTVRPLDGAADGQLQAQLETEGRVFDQSPVRIDYPHIPLQQVLVPARCRLVSSDIAIKGRRIGYIAGAGDEVPQGLMQIGYEVTMIAPADISASYLSRFDAVITGIRAYNTVEELGLKQDELLAYVKNGGNLLVQYNTVNFVSNLVTESMAPYKLELSRTRVTDHTAPVIFLEPNHPALNSPNEITEADFDGWAQERGLYFANKWAKKFTPVLAMNDAGEPPAEGSLLIAPHGEGYFVYTGLSFFRQLPAGVPGAYRLIANLLSL